MYGTQEVTFSVPSWGRAMHGTQEVNWPMGFVLWRAYRPLGTSLLAARSPWGCGASALLSLGV